MSSAPSGNLALQRVELGDALEIRDRIIFDFYPGLPHILKLATSSWSTASYMAIYAVSIKK